MVSYCNNRFTDLALLGSVVSEHFSFDMIQIHDKKFKRFISEKEISRIIKNIADNINRDYSNKELLVIGILNGAFIFVSDLMKLLKIDPKISFLKFTSYAGISSSGVVNTLIGLNEDLKGKHVLVVEDIVDTGKTLTKVLNVLESSEPASLKVATLFFKPDAYQSQYPIAYIGKEIPNKFVVGYGMDYNGNGRGLTDLYQLVE